MRKVLLVSLIGLATIGFAQTNFDAKFRAKDANGRGLSQRNYRNEDSTKLAGISVNALDAAGVRSTTLTGLSTISGATITSSSTILQAFGQLQKQVSDNTQAVATVQDTSTALRYTVAPLFKTYIDGSTLKANRTMIQPDASSTYSVIADNHPRLLRTLNKLYDITTNVTQQLRLLTWSDSMNGLGSNSCYEQFARNMGASYGDIGSGTAPTISASGAAGTLFDNWTRWVDGNVFYTDATGSVTWGRGGSTAYANILKVYYIKEPGAGTFKVQTSVNGSTWTDEVGYTNIDANNVSSQLGIITIPKTLGFYMLRVVGLSGRVYFTPNATGQFRTSSVSGVEVANIAVGGIALTNMNLCPSSIIGAWLSDYSPDLAFWEMKESINTLPASLPVFWSMFTSSSPSTDWVFFGSTPDSPSSTNTIATNLLLKSHCYNNKAYYFDAFELFQRDWSLANAQGFYGDGTHRNEKGNAYLAGHLMKQLGLFLIPNGTNPIGVSSSKEVKSSAAISLVNNLITGAGSLAKLQLRSGSANQDAEIALNRTLFISAGGNFVSFNPSGAGVSGVPTTTLTTRTNFGATDIHVARESGPRLKFYNNSNTGEVIARFLAPSGTPAAPGYAFENSFTRGIYLNGNGFGFSTNSTHRGGVTNAGWQIGGAGTDITQIRVGTATLSAGTATVLDANVTVNSTIVVTSQSGTTIASYRISAKTAGISFIIASSNSEDTNTVGYIIYN